MRTERRKLMASGGLPSSYERLKYLYVNKNAYIDTGITAKTFYIDVDLYVKVKELSYAACLWCARNTNKNTNSVLFFSAAYSKNIRYDMGELGKNFPIGHDVITNIKGFGRELYLNNAIAYNSTGTNNNNNNNLLLFASKVNSENKDENIDNSFNNVSEHKIFQIKITKDSNKDLDAHFIPVKRKGDGVIGMYDLVGMKFYTSPNGVAFSGGVKSKGLIDSLFEPIKAERRAA